MKLKSNEYYMLKALEQAKKAAAENEVPVGCVIVYQDKIIARGYNKRNLKKTTLAHAEIIAIAKAGKVIGDWRLEDCILESHQETIQLPSTVHHLVSMAHLQTTLRLHI